MFHPAADHSGPYQTFGPALLPQNSDRVGGTVAWSFYITSREVRAIDRDEALRLLRAGGDGVRQWNERLDGGEWIPDLSGADLNRADLSRANLSWAGLTGPTCARPV